MTLRIALVSCDGAGSPALVGLAKGLRALGHAPTIIGARVGTPGSCDRDGVRTTHVPRLPEGLLARRGFSGPITHVPALAATLVRGRHDVLHAFTPSDALAARPARRRTGAPLVFTCGEVLERDTVADTRLRLALLAAAVEQSDAVLAPDEEGARGLQRWMGCHARIVAPADAAAHLEVYAGAGAHRVQG